jgi:GTP-binding protein HflX
VDDVLYRNLVPIEVKLPYSAGNLLTVFHEQGSVEQIQHLADGVHISGRLPGRLLATFRHYAIPADRNQTEE